MSGDARRDRLQQLLATAPFDAVLLTSPESVDYATGYRSVAAQIFAGYPLAALVTGDAVLLLSPAGDTAAALAAGVPAETIVPFGRFYFTGDSPAAAMSDMHPDRAGALATALGRLNVSTLGVEGSPADLRFGRLKTTDATEWVMTVRAVKLPFEQQRLRKAAQLAEEGIAAALAIAAEGVTERDLAARVAATMAAGGGMPRFVVVTTGGRSPLADAFPTDLAARPGDLIRFDIGCVYEGYWSDIARTAVVGEPTPRQSSTYRALLEGMLAEFDVVKPGATAGEVFAAAQSTVERVGGPNPYRRHHVGHAIGLSVYERPIIAEGNPTVLEPGMVFCLETPYYELGWGGMMVEDTGVVTGDGFELFTGMDRSLLVVPR